MFNANPFSFARCLSPTYATCSASCATFIESSRMLPLGHSQSSRLNFPNGGFVRVVQLVDLISAIRLTRFQSIWDFESLSSFFCPSLNNCKSSSPVSGAFTARYFFAAKMTDSRRRRSNPLHTCSVRVRPMDQRISRRRGVAILP